MDRLLREGELSAGELNETQSISPPAISRHLKILREAGIINQRVDKMCDNGFVDEVREITDVWIRQYNECRHQISKYSLAKPRHWAILSSKK